MDRRKILEMQQQSGFVLRLLIEDCFPLTLSALHPTD